MTNYISSKTVGSLSTALSLDDDITLFDEQLTGWLFEHVRELGSAHYSNHEHSGFAILMLVTAYFESIEAFKRGAPGPSKAYFVAGIRDVFPSLTSMRRSVLEELYDQLRCGLYHQSAPKSRVSIAHASQPIAIELDAARAIKGVTIDPWALAKAVESHFRQYIVDLRNPKNAALRHAFATFRAWRRASPGQFTAAVVGARSTHP